MRAAVMAGIGAFRAFGTARRGGGAAGWPQRGNGWGAATRAGHASPQPKCTRRRGGAGSAGRRGGAAVGRRRGTDSPAVTAHRQEGGAARGAVLEAALGGTLRRFHRYFPWARRTRWRCWRCRRPGSGGYLYQQHHGFVAEHARQRHHADEVSVAEMGIGAVALVSTPSHRGRALAASAAVNRQLLYRAQV